MPPNIIQLCPRSLSCSEKLPLEVDVSLYGDPQLNKVQRARDFRTLSTKWDVCFEPPLQAKATPQKVKQKGQWGMKTTKKMSSRQNRTDTLMNTQ